jgi:phage terminase large subunit-like protein
VIFSVPDLDGDGAEWPTLGPQVCDYIEDFLVFGPGDLLGQPALIDVEKRALIYRFYEVYPRGAKDANGKSIAGRRRFRRCAISLQKGTAKTELAAWIAGVELAPDSPVRCDGFDAYGQPVGRPVVDPYIPMVAYTEEQSEDLAYAALKAILERSSISRLFDIGIDRIKRSQGDGKAAALAGAPDSRDGARTTFAHKDETHRWNLERLRRAHRVMIANLPKRLLADPWELETTTAFTPGENSAAEQTMNYARQVASGAIKDSRLFFFHRQASDFHNLETVEGRRAAVTEAAGPTAPWRDIEGIVDQWQDPEADFAYLERVYLNRPAQAAAQAFDVKRWADLADLEYRPAPGAFITLGFDGAVYHDGCALIGTEVATGFQWPLGTWVDPMTRAEWATPMADVDAAVEAAFAEFKVWRMYCDPFYFEGWVAVWQGRYGEKRVIEWRTNRILPTAIGLKAYRGAMQSGDVTHSGDKVFAQHIANAQRSNTNYRDDQGEPLWLIRKERPDSPNKIDAAMAGLLSWEARTDAIAADAKPKSTFHGIDVPD